MSSKLRFLQHKEKKIKDQLMNHTLTNQMRGKLERNLNNVKHQLQTGGRTRRHKRSKRSNRTRRHR